LFFRGLFFGGHVSVGGSERGVAVAVFAVCFEVKRRGGEVSFEGHDDRRRRRRRRSGLGRLAGVGGGGQRRRRALFGLPAMRRYAVVYRV
jgi:hypothetical protein